MKKNSGQKHLKSKATSTKLKLTLWLKAKTEPLEGKLKMAKVSRRDKTNTNFSFTDRYLEQVTITKPAVPQETVSTTEQQ